MNTFMRFDDVDVVKHGQSWKFIQVLKHCNSLGISGYEVDVVKMQEMHNGIEYTFTSKPVRLKTKIIDFMERSSRGSKPY